MENNVTPVPYERQMQFIKLYGTNDIKFWWLVMKVRWKDILTLKQARQNAGLSVAVVSKRLGVSPGYIYKAENGNISVRLYRQLQFKNLYSTKYISFKESTNNGKTTIYADRYWIR
jgi:DNA-binding XRE family transcriptional regulator